MKKSIPLLLALALTLVTAIVFGLVRGWPNLPESVTMQNAGILLAPIAFAATVVERGVEILISPWRDAEANKLQNAIAAIKARPAPDPATAQKNAADLKVASDELEEYRGTTQRYAFVISLILSTFVSIAGFRALGPFLSPMAFAPNSPAKAGQEGFFLCVDIALSAIVLAGGADGIHSIVNAVTTYFDSTAAKAANS